MLKFSFLFLIFFLSVKVPAQLAIINDPDGFTNVRENKSVSSKVMGRLYKDDIFLYSFDRDDDQWVGVFYSKSDKSYIQGYIHKSRLLPIDELEHVTWKGNNRIEKTNELFIKK
jgi:hypothetical protein